jgi:hypothetical protein
MEKIQPITRDPGRTVNGGRVVPQRTADVARRERHEILEPVSWSSALCEQERLYRAGKTIAGAADLVEIADERFVEADQRLRQAAAVGASPLLLAGMERLHMTLHAGTRFVVGEVLTNPYDRY